MHGYGRRVVILGEKMFSHKKVISVSRGCPVAVNAKHLHAGSSFDLWEVPCNKDGSTDEPKTDKNTEETEDGKH